MLVNVFNFMDPQEPQKLSGESFFETAETGDGNDLGREEIGNRNTRGCFRRAGYEHILGDVDNEPAAPTVGSRSLPPTSFAKLRRVWRRSDSSPIQSPN